MEGGEKPYLLQAWRQCAWIVGDVEFLLLTLLTMVSIFIPNDCYDNLISIYLWSVSIGNMNFIWRFRSCKFPVYFQHVQK
jgi:hypothetical protein